ncbi:diaminopimelate epimerase [Desulfohalotomaculum tongense]|uniref:diaminopimelate epimerase n=1 Tax=Desulforadius tongensis TaxID=1216062 RepID=UPI001EE56E22|nr:diaminopimelate epimerase [Desulforadius tongensis]MBM7855730.1 diaminopimelate epimerase [Desulforadius tongensis]
MRFTKVHGLGNDFVIVNCLQGAHLPGDLAQLARDVCHRNFGIGADGLVLLRPSETGDLRMQIINSDGSEAEMCGNAIRCVAKYVYDHDIVKKQKIRVETLAGIIVPEVIVEDGAVSMVRVDMGEPRLERAQIPMTGPEGRAINQPLVVEDKTYNITAVSMGNPHCVIFVPDVESVPLSEIGPKIEKHPAFPQKTNVEFVQVLSKEEVRMRVWERGAGITMACGTGACATGVAAALNGFTGRKVTVHLDGGPLIIEWAGDNRVYMTGPAAEVFSGEYAPAKH